MNDKNKNIMDVLMDRMMISCDKATLLISKAEEEKLSCGEKYHLQVHLMGCKFCRRYKKEIRYMSQAIDKFKESSAFSSKLPPDKKKTIQENLDKEMNKDK